MKNGNIYTIFVGIQKQITLLWRSRTRMCKYLKMLT